MLRLEDTIAAIATANGAGAARGILRVSGPSAIDCLRGCFMPTEACEPLCLRDPTVISGEFVGAFRLPCDAYIWPTRRSYTRQPVVELHTLGSLPLLEAALRTLCANGARAAQPGEFTLRAFLAGRLDLVQAEAVLGAIDADDRRALDVALAQLAGGLSAPLERLRGDLLDLLADLEAGLDFAEEHIEFVTSNEIIRRIAAAHDQTRQIAGALSARSVAAGAPRVVLVGWPNTGKSSLFNALAGNGCSLVSPSAGTTRDYLEAHADFAGVKCVLIDTAGIDLDVHAATIAASAQSMAESQHRQADLRLFCIDATRPLNELELKRTRQPRDDTLVVLTKCDGPIAVSLNAAAAQTSAVRRWGLDELRAKVASRLAARVGAGQYAVASTALRCGESVALATQCLALALQCASSNAGNELVACELRAALDALGQVTGAIYTVDVLDRVFSRFCIGK